MSLYGLAIHFLAGGTHQCLALMPDCKPSDCLTAVNFFVANKWKMESGHFIFAFIGIMFSWGHMLQITEKILEKWYLLEMCVNLPLPHFIHPHFQFFLLIVSHLSCRNSCV